MSRLASMVWAVLLTVLCIMLALRPTAPESTPEARLHQGWQQLREEILVLNARLRPLIHTHSPITPAIQERIQIIEREVDAQVGRARRIGWTYRQIIDELYRIRWYDWRRLIKPTEPLLVESA